MKKTVPQKLYQFITLPVGVMIGGDITILNILDFSAEDAFSMARKLKPGRNLQLVGFTDAEKFIEQMKVTPEILCKEGTPIEKWHKKVEVKNETDYTKRTEEEITRLIKYLRDAGYDISKKHKK